VILLAVVVAMLVMVVLPAAAFGTAIGTGYVQINGPTFTNSTSLTVAAGATLNNPRQVKTYQWRWVRWNTTVEPWTVAATGILSPAVTLSPAVNPWENLSIPVMLPNVFGTYSIDVFIEDNIPAPNHGTLWLYSADSNSYVSYVSSAPPISTVSFYPTGHWGRGDINWTNGKWNDGVVEADFNQMYSSPMGITHWIVTKNSDAPITETPLTWSPWGASWGNPPTQDLVGPPAWNMPKYSNDGVYAVQHWAVSATGVRQVKDSTDYIGYDTKAPYVVWHWPATSTGYYTSSIDFTADVIDDGGSGVAGYITDGNFFAPRAWVQWKSADTGYAWQDAPAPQGTPAVTIDAFDFFTWHIKGTIYVKPYYNAQYRVVVTGSDYAGNGGFPDEAYPIPTAPSGAKTTKTADSSQLYLGVGYPGASVVVDNMAPSTVFTSSPTGAAQTAPSYAAWTNKNVTVDFIASDAGGSSITSGVAYTEYIVGNSGTTPPLLDAKGTQGTEVVISQNAPVGPVYLWYRSVDKAGNKEKWNLAWVWFDNKGPVLTSNYSGLWYRDDFKVVLSATDPNSALAAPGIEYQVPGWPFPWALPWIRPMLPTKWTPLSQNPGIVDVPVDPYPNSRTDGIWPLNYRATDQAGNQSVETSLTVKIDTRPPTTAGTTPYGDAMWINGTIPYTLTSTDQNPGAGVKVTFYRVDQSTPWQASVNAAPSTTFATPITLAPATQGAMHTIDFFSIDNAVTATSAADPKVDPYPGNVEKGVVVGWAPIAILPYVNITTVAGYKTTTVKLDVTAPVVTAMDPKNGNWQKPIATVNFSGTDVGSGYNHTEWSTDGTNWTSGEQAQVGGDGVTTISYRGVDNVGIKSAIQTIQVKVASTPPTVTSENSSVPAGKRWHNPTITFNITAVTPTATAVIQIRTLSGRTISTHHYANVATGTDVSKTFILNTPLKAGKYNIRVGAVDQAGNVQTKRGSSRLTVTK